MKTYYNTLAIVSINIFDVRESPWYRYVNEKRIAGYTIRKGGFIDTIIDEYVSKEDIEKQKQLFIDGQTVMIKPHVTVQYANDEEHTTYHDTYEEAIKFAEHIKKYHDKYLDLDDISIKKLNLKNEEKSNTSLKNIKLYKRYFLDVGSSVPIEVEPVKFNNKEVLCRYLSSYADRTEMISSEIFEMNGYKIPEKYKK